MNLNDDSLGKFIKRINYFGFPVYSPLALFVNGNTQKERDVINLVSEQLTPFFSSLGKNQEECKDCWKAIEDECRNGIKNVLAGTSLLKAERIVEQNLRKLLGFTSQQGDPRITALDNLLKERARKIVEQITVPLSALPAGSDKPFLAKREGVAVLDMGAGDGMVSHCLLEAAAGIGLRFGVMTLADIHTYWHGEVETNGSFERLELEPDYDRVPLKKQNKYDLILLLTVLHHSYDPKRTFRACWEVLAEGGLIIVIESCVAVTQKFVMDHQNHLNQNQLDKNVANYDKTLRFVKLAPPLKGMPDRQVMYAGFIDWFYNRVQHEDVLVPCEYNSPEQWNTFFKQFAGLHCLKTYAEGFDQPTVPEFHTMHVVRKETGG